MNSSNRSESIVYLIFAYVRCKDKLFGSIYVLLEGINVLLEGWQCLLCGNFANSMIQIRGKVTLNNKHERQKSKSSCFVIRTRMLINGIFPRVITSNNQIHEFTDA
jgi:hypothetical protein